jgi:demethylmenaquinone methyltransferase / 2-methoxy-6-polyprenyl-1,4-benzoquinol methylase
LGTKPLVRPVFAQVLTSTFLARRFSGFIYDADQLHRESVKSTAQKFFAELARSYDRTADYAMLFQDRWWKNWATKWLSPVRGSVMLDVGCGTLIFEERLAHAGCRFVSLDLSRDMVVMGQRKNLSNVTLLMNGDAEYLPFLDRSFDHVVSCFVAKYVGASRFASELARVSASGARVVVYDLARPRGPLAPFVELYIQGGLRIVGFVLGHAGKKGAFTFSKLPSVVRESSWDSRIVAEMEKEGFETLATARLTSGVVFAYCGRRR